MEQNIIETFHKLEKECIGYDNMVDCSDENYLKTLDGLRQVVTDIQKESMFSPNEAIEEVATENLKLLMAPFYEADVLFRIMDKRHERVKMAHCFYLEYLRLLDHYGVLEKHQKKILKTYIKKQKINYTKERTDASAEEVKEVENMLKELLAEKPNPYEDREAKVADFKMKKLISQQMDDLKDYRDEEMKRQFYMAYLRRSIFDSFEKLRLIEMELDILRHQQSLTPQQIEEERKRSEKPENLPPLQWKTITKESLNETPYLMRPSSEPLGLGVVNEYVDPEQRIVVEKQTIDGRVDLRSQYKKQVFRPGHNMPTKTLEELAEEEMADAMARQAQEQQAELEKAAEDSEDEEVLERERKKTQQLEDWKDFVPKGRGITKHL